MFMLLTKREKKTSIYYTYSQRKQCFTCVLHRESKSGSLLQVPWHFKGTIFHTVLSRRGCAKKKEAMTDRKQLFIRIHIHKVYRQLHAPFSRTAGTIHICLHCAENPLEKYPQFQHRERITAFPYVALCRRGHINLSLVSCSFIYS